jgi:hypothetical protein
VGTAILPRCTPPITTDFTAWHAGPTVFVVTAVGALAIAAFVTAMAGRPLSEDQLLEH